MAKSQSNLSDKERKELGVNIDNPSTIPENISPVLKANLIEEYKKNSDVQTAQDMPSATEVGNELARERAAADGDKDMQKYLNDTRSAPEPTSATKSTAKADNTKPTAKRQNEL